jgi:hypothetical protein
LGRSTVSYGTAHQGCCLFERRASWMRLAVRLGRTLIRAPEPPVTGSPTAHARGLRDDSGVRRRGRRQRSTDVLPALDDLAALLRAVARPATSGGPIGEPLCHAPLPVFGGWSLERADLVLTNCPDSWAAAAPVTGGVVIPTHSTSSSPVARPSIEVSPPGPRSLLSDASRRSIGSLRSPAVDRSSSI